MIAQLIRAAAHTSERMHLKKIIPPRLIEALRFALLRRSVQSFPDRRYLEDEILPALAALTPVRTLFVGCEPYTKPYGKAFQSEGQEYWTTDIKPDAAAWGEKAHHRTADIREIRAHFPPRHFELVILNGVFGFGVNDARGMGQTLKGIAACLTPGGYLLVGWNPHLIEQELDTLEELNRWFVSAPLGSLPARRDFRDSEIPHSFLLLQTRAPAPTPF